MVHCQLQLALMLLFIWQAKMVYMPHVIHKSYSDASLLSCICMSSSAYMM